MLRPSDSCRGPDCKSKKHHFEANFSESSAKGIFLLPLRMIKPHWLQSECRVGHFTLNAAGAEARLPLAPPSKGPRGVWRVGSVRLRGRVVTTGATMKPECLQRETEECAGTLPSGWSANQNYQLIGYLDVHICIYLYTCTCIYVCVYLYIICGGVNIHIYILFRRYIYIYILLSGVCIYICIYTVKEFMYIIYVYAYTMSIYAYVFICICIYIYVYIHCWLYMHTHNILLSKCVYIYLYTA